MLFALTVPRPREYTMLGNQWADRSVAKRVDYELVSSHICSCPLRSQSTDQILNFIQHRFAKGVHTC